MEANLQLNSFQAPLLEESRESLVKGQRQRLLESTSRVHHLDHNPALHTVAQKNQGSKVGSLWELKRYICGSFVVSFFSSPAELNLNHSKQISFLSELSFKEIKDSPGFSATNISSRPQQHCSFTWNKATN